MTLTWPTKDPNDVLDYQLDWTARLGGDTISTSTWLIASGDITIDSDSNTTTVTTVWLSGGTADTTVVVTNRIATSGGRTMDQSVRLKLKER